MARPRTAFVSIVTSLVLTIGRVLAGDPFGIDQADAARVIPIVVTATDHLLERSGTAVPAAGPAALRQK